MCKIISLNGVEELDMLFYLHLTRWPGSFAGVTCNFGNASLHHMPGLSFCTFGPTITQRYGTEKTKLIGHLQQKRAALQTAAPASPFLTHKTLTVRTQWVWGRQKGRRRKPCLGGRFTDNSLSGRGFVNDLRDYIIWIWHKHATLC